MLMVPGLTCSTPDRTRRSPCSHVGESPALTRLSRAGDPMRLAQIADGYHRVCASYLTDENTDIPVRIIDVPGSR